MHYARSESTQRQSLSCHAFSLLKISPDKDLCLSAAKLLVVRDLTGQNTVGGNIKRDSVSQSVAKII